MREKTIERKLVTAVKAAGGIAPKFTSPGFGGMPDRIVLLPGGHIAFVEVKAPGEKPRPLQLARHKLLRGLDRSFESILRIEQHESREIKMVEKTILDRAFDPDEIELIKDLILPSQGKTPSYNTAYGVFLGYSIGLSSEGRSSEEYENLVMQKMAYDIKQHAEYIAEKIRLSNLGSHSFYFYILPFDDAESEKKAIMENVMKGDVML